MNIDGDSNDLRAKSGEAGVDEMLAMLSEVIQDAWALPLSGDKCVIEREKLLDMVDEIRQNLPADFKQARSIVERRREIVDDAEKRAETIIKRAEERAKNMVNEDGIVIAAKQKANEIIVSAENRVKELKKATGDFVDESLRRAEENIGETLSDIKKARQQFRAGTVPQK